MSKGTIEQKERWALDLLTLDKIGAWAITEPNSGSDAFGMMQSTAKRDGDEYILNGSKTFITNGPYADTTVFICKLDEGNPPDDRKVLTFVLERGMEGFEQSKPLRKMGLHSSPTGQLFLTDVRVGRDRLLGETEDVPAGGREGAKATFVMERTGVAAMALGIVERCLELCLDYAKERVQFGKPIGEYQLIQLKLAKMEVARVNLQNLVFRQIEMSGAGKVDEPGGGVGVQALRRPGGDGGRARGGAALRRQRLHGRVRGRAAVPRRQGAPDLRRHRRDPGLPDRPHAVGGAGVELARAMPVEPPPTRWELPSPEAAGEEEVAGVGADLEPGTLLAAYRSGLFPMRVGRDGPIGWWSPDPRRDHLARRLAREPLAATVALASSKRAWTGRSRT